MLDLTLSNDLHATVACFGLLPIHAKRRFGRSFVALHSVAWRIFRSRIVPYCELEKNKEAIARLGARMKGVQAIPR